MSHRSSFAGRIIARFNFIVQPSTYQYIVYLLIWSTLWAVCGLVIVTSLSMSIAGGLGALDWSMIVTLFALSLAFLTTSVERPLLVFLAGGEVGPIEYPAGDGRERLFEYLWDIRSLGTLLLAGVKWIIGTVVATASVFLLFVSGALLMLPVEYNDPRTPEIGTELLLGAPRELSWTIEFVYNLWTLTFSYSTYIGSIGVTTLLDAVIAGGIGLVLLVLTVYLLSIGGQSLAKANEWSLRYSRPLSVEAFHGLLR